MREPLQLKAYVFESGNNNSEPNSTFEYRPRTLSLFHKT